MASGCPCRGTRMGQDGSSREGAPCLVVESLLPVCGYWGSEEGGSAGDEMMSCVPCLPTVLLNRYSVEKSNIDRTDNRDSSNNFTRRSILGILLPLPSFWFDVSVFKVVTVLMEEKLMIY